jgi:protein-S-isoprenylcysteine O-methyltransferase Ste14
VSTPNHNPAAGPDTGAPTGAGPTPPKEPFSYVSQDRGLLTLKIREPALMALFFLAFIVVGVIFFLMLKKQADAGADGALNVGYLILVIFGGLGLVGVGIALRRWAWKREYVRVMGRSPWS